MGTSLPTLRMSGISRGTNLTKPLQSCKASITRGQVMSQKHFDLYHREGAFPSADKTIISTAWGPIELQCNGTGDFLILLHGLQSSMEVWRETVRQLPRLRGDSLSREASKHHRLEYGRHCRASIPA